MLLTHVVSVGIAGPDDLKGWHRGIRLAGIQIPGIMTVGMLRQGGQLTGCDVRRGSSVVVIPLRDERLTRLLVEVEDPLAITRTLDQALAGANVRSEASIR